LRKEIKPFLKVYLPVGYRPDANATKKPWEWGSIFGNLFKKKSNKT